MSIAVLSLLFTFGVLAHNAEEAMLPPRWSRSVGKWRAPVESQRFLFAVTVLSVVLVLAGIAAFAWGPRSAPAYFFAGYVFAMVANVLFPHVLGSIALRTYIPGTATALLFNAPLGAIVPYRMDDEGFVERAVLFWTAPIVALGITGTMPVLFRFAGRRCGIRTDCAKS